MRLIGESIREDTLRKRAKREEGGSADVELSDVRAPIPFISAIPATVQTFPALLHSPLALPRPPTCG